MAPAGFFGMGVNVDRTDLVYINHNRLLILMA
jgi:hypothetical protein